MSLSEVWMARSKDPVTEVRLKRRRDEALERSSMICRKSLKADSAGPSTSPCKKYALDLDTLECPICTLPFSPPVFQCENGHAACAACCKKIDAKGCPSCSLPIGRIRCRAFEKLIESVRVECGHGCARELKYSDSDEHERNLCEYRPVKCPLHRCTHKGPLYTIPEHLAETHAMPTVECCESTRSASFQLGDSDTALLCKAKEACLLISKLGHEDDHKFFCESLWAAKEVEYKLTVKPVNRKSKSVYSMQDVVPSSLYHDSDDCQFLVVPGNATAFEMTLSLV